MSEQPKFDIGDASDHLALTRDVAEGLNLAACGLSAKEERNAMAALIEHLIERLDFVHARLSEIIKGDAS